jgi:hypothetical protein
MNTPKNACDSVKTVFIRVVQGCLSFGIDGIDSFIRLNSGF